MTTKVYRVALIVWNTAALCLAVTNANYGWPDATAMLAIVPIGNAIIVAFRQILDGSTPTFPTGGGE